MTISLARNRAFYIGLICILAALIVSGISPFDRTTWILEVFPVLIALPILVFTRAKFTLTSLVFFTILIHSLILIIGGMYSYARVPIGFWIADFFSLTRNPYDKIGHFAQGFTPCLLAREIFIRRSIMKRSAMLSFVVISIALAISAFYELIEWWSALILGQGADEFLGTQGYVWDTQSDIMFALIGSVSAILLFSITHDKQISRVSSER
jgi:putative membrane protein